LLADIHTSNTASNAQAVAAKPRASVVLDTNVALDWLLFRNPRVDSLARALGTGQLRWLACPATRDELTRMLGHRSLARWAPDVAAAMARHDALATPLPPPVASRLLRCRDPDDQVFVDLALAHRARWLFSHDRALLTLAGRARRLGLSIIVPQRWTGP
jgi:predicted nucleic acid-binding protein